MFLMYLQSQLWVTMVSVEALNPKLDKYWMFKNIFQEVFTVQNEAQTHIRKNLDKLAKLINALINCRASRLLLCGVR